MILQSSKHTQKRTKFSKLWLGLAGAIVLSAVSPVLGQLQAVQLQAVQLSDGTTVFNTPPRLVDFTALRRDANDRRAIYYVTVDIPANAGEPLKALQVTLIRGRSIPRLRYRLDDIEVFQGNRRNRGEALPVATADYDRDTKTLTVQLKEAAAPGQLITFALKPVRNPSRQGVYLFDIGAAPEGENPVMRRIGTGRLDIFEDADPS